MRKYKYFVGGLIAITLSFFMFGRVGVSASSDANNFVDRSSYSVVNHFKTTASTPWAFDWLVAPIQEGLTDLVELLTDWVTNSLEWAVGGELIQIWTAFLPIANIAFAIVFIIVIYSTATGAGLNNYSIKKIMPRLIIVAIAVNVSYYICVALADVSNIIGANVGSLFPALSNTPSDSFGIITNNILSEIDGVGIVIFIFISSGIVALSILIIFLVITARYVVLFLLVVASPLAIVCALLPQTEKWFRKWLNTYVQMLVAYPIFMFAWSAIEWIQDSPLLLSMNSVSEDGLTVVLIGDIISILLPIAPVFLIIPAMKLGGGLVSKISGGIQNGVQNSGIGRVAKQYDNTNRPTASTSAGVNKFMVKQDKEKDTGNLERTINARNNDMINAARAHGYTGNNASGAENHLRHNGFEDELNKINNAHATSINSIMLDDIYNENGNKDNAGRIRRNKKLNNSIGRQTAAFTTGASTGKIDENRSESVGAKVDFGHKGQKVYSDTLREGRYNKNLETNLDNGIVDGAPALGGTVSTVQKSPKSLREGSTNASVENSKLNSNVNQEGANNTINNMKSQDSGALFRDQANLNKYKRMNEFPSALLEADIERQKLMNSNHVENMVQIKGSIEQLDGVQEVKANIADMIEDSVSHGLKTISGSSSEKEKSSEKTVEDQADAQTSEDDAYAEDMIAGIAEGNKEKILKSEAITSADSSSIARKEAAKGALARKLTIKADRDDANAAEIKSMIDTEVTQEAQRADMNKNLAENINTQTSSRTTMNSEPMINEQINLEISDVKKTIDSRKTLIEGRAEEYVRQGQPRWTTIDAVGHATEGAVNRILREAVTNNNGGDVVTIMEMMSNNGQEGIDDWAKFIKENIKPNIGLVDANNQPVIDDNGSNVATDIAAAMLGGLRPKIEEAFPALVVFADSFKDGKPTKSLEDCALDPGTYSALKPEQLAGMSEDSLKYYKKVGKPDSDGKLPFDQTVDALLGSSDLILDKIKDKMLTEWGIKVSPSGDYQRI